jgi:uncharacterized protein YqjF (DUF2071 family)
MTSQQADGIVHYSSRRRNASAEFRGHYEPISDVKLAQKGSIEHWLTERYCLFTAYQGRVYRGDIHHLPWPLQNAQAELKTNTVAAAAGISLPHTAPLLHFARKLEVLIWPLRPAKEGQRV